MRCHLPFTAIFRCQVLYFMFILQPSSLIWYLATFQANFKATKNKNVFVWPGNFYGEGELRPVYWVLDQRKFLQGRDSSGWFTNSQVRSTNVLGLEEKKLRSGNTTGNFMATNTNLYTCMCRKGHHCLLGTGESYDLIAQHNRKIVHSSFYS